jgi:rubrerythrin
MSKKRFKDLSEKEILALAIQLEEEDARVYGDFAEGLRETYPSTTKMFEDMQAEESRHRQSLIDLYRQSHSADSSPGCKRFRRAPPRMARPSARHQQGPQASRNHGTGNATLLRTRSTARFRCSHAEIAR